MRKVVKTERRRRGIFGTIFKWLFVLFNILMAAVIFFAWFIVKQSTTQALDTSHIAAGSLQSSAVTAGGLAAGGIVTSILLVIWLVGGIVLGTLALATRGKIVWVEDVPD